MAAPPPIMDHTAFRVLFVLHILLQTYLKFSVSVGWAIFDEESIYEISNLNFKY